MATVRDTIRGTDATETGGGMLADVATLRVTILPDDLNRFGPLGAFDAAVAELRVQYLAAVERGKRPDALYLTLGETDAKR